MGYYNDLKTISIGSYQERLKSAYLPPSRMILKTMLQPRFDYFRNIGIENVQELLTILKKKDKITELALVDILNLEYLTILLREIKSMHPKPNRIKDFEGISNATIYTLEKDGIKNTKVLFDKVKTKTTRKELAEKLKINESEILELTKLADLSRIKWVGATFARILYDLGVDTVEKTTQIEPILLHKEINRINKERNYYKGKIGLNDVKILINAAKEVPIEIEY